MSVSNKALSESFSMLTDLVLKAMFEVESNLTTNLLCDVSTREL